jgi:hypothetical protein
LKLKGSQLLNEVDSLRIIVQKQDETIKDLQGKLEKLMKAIPEDDDPYLKNPSSRLGFVSGRYGQDQPEPFRYKSLVHQRIIGNLDVDHIDYLIDGLMFTKILKALRYNDKVKRIKLELLPDSDVASYPKADVNINEDRHTRLFDKSQPLDCNWLSEIYDKLADLIACNTTVKNIVIFSNHYVNLDKSEVQKLGKAISGNAVLEELSFPSSDMFQTFLEIGPYILKNKQNGGKLKTMRFKNQTDPKVLQLQILLNFGISEKG